MYKGGSNTDSGSKRGVYCSDTAILYLAFIIRNLFQTINEEIKIVKILV